MVWLLRWNSALVLLGTSEHHVKTAPLDTRDQAVDHTLALVYPFSAPDPESLHHTPVMMEDVPARLMPRVLTAISAQQIHSICRLVIHKDVSHASARVLLNSVNRPVSVVSWYEHNGD
ncbi:hypothetical protein COOONC_10184 [Cooperia oncophora]